MGWSFKSLDQKVRDFNREHKKALRVRRVDVTDGAGVKHQETQVLNHFDTILTRGSNNAVAEKLDQILEATLQGRPAVQK